MMEWKGRVFIGEGGRERGRGGGGDASWKRGEPMDGAVGVRACCTLSSPN